MKRSELSSDRLDWTFGTMRDDGWQLVRESADGSLREIEQVKNRRSGEFLLVIGRESVVINEDNAVEAEKKFREGILKTFNSELLL